jgi:hypothetical protein
MEPQITALDSRLENDREWREAAAKLDERLLRTSLDSVKLITRFFAHEEDQPGPTLTMAWLSLEAQLLHFFRELDSTGISRIIGEVAPEYLSNFSFSNAGGFREIEEGLLRDLDVPPEGWDRFWALADEYKGEVLSQMREQSPYSAYQHVADRITGRLGDELGPYTHLSPFKWWKPVVAGLGAAVGIIDGIAVAPTGGIAITSYVASVAAAVATAIEPGRGPRPA